MKRRILAFAVALSCVFSFLSFSASATDFVFSGEPDEYGVLVEAKGSDYGGDTTWDGGFLREVDGDKLLMPADMQGNIWGFYLSNDSVNNMQPGTYKISYYLTLDENIETSLFRMKPYNEDFGTDEPPLDLLQEYAGQKVILTEVVNFSSPRREFATCWKGYGFAGTLDKVIWTTADTNIYSLPQSEGYTLIREVEFRGDTDIGEWTRSYRVSSECDIKEFRIGQFNFKIEGTNMTATVPYGTNLIAHPSYTLSEGATITSPTDLTKIDFSKPVTFVVTASDGVTTKTYTANVTVLPAPVSKIKLSPSTKILDIGKSVKINATITPSAAANKTLKWTTSNSKVATVSNGKVTAKGAGVATIKAAATDGSGIYATVNIKVKPAKVKNVKAKKSGSNGIKITFSKVKGADKYMIVMQKNKKGSFKKIYLGKTPSYTKKGLKKGTVYRFKVCAYNAKAKLYGNYSSPVQIKR